MEVGDLVKVTFPAFQDETGEWCPEEQFLMVVNAASDRWLYAMVDGDGVSREYCELVYSASDLQEMLTKSSKDME